MNLEWCAMLRQAIIFAAGLCLTVSAAFAQSAPASEAEALRRELGSKGIKVSLIEPGLVGADFQYPDIPSDKQVEMINDEKMLRAEDIAVGIQYLLTQPARTVVQQLVIVPRVQDE